MSQTLKYLTVVLILCISSATLLKIQAQSPLVLSEDSTKTKKHSPVRATVFSAILPGLGQAYNQKYWKIPIIYAGIAGIVYLIDFNQDGYVYFKKKYIAESELTSPNTQDLGFYEDNAKAYRRNRDLSVVGLLAFWGLNVIDANVDAHFFNYDISPDLSLELKPVYSTDLQGTMQPGLRLSLKF